MSTPLFSIITVTYNRGYILERAIKSVLNQTFKDFEYIVIDGNSSDNSLDLIKTYEKIFNDNSITFKYISESDEGLYQAMNKGIILAKGKYIGIVNSDDIYYDDTLEKVSKFAQSTDSPDVIHGNMEMIDNRGNRNIIRPKTKINPYRNIPSLHPATFIANKLFKEYGFYDTNFKIAADQDFLLRVFLNQRTFYYIDEVLCHFSSDGISSTSFLKPLIESYQVKKKNHLGLFRSKYNFVRSLIIRLLQKVRLLYLLKRLVGRAH